MDNMTKQMLLYISALGIPYLLYLFAILREKFYEWLNEDDTRKDE